MQAMISSEPELIVGIDLGQTCTGVAYNNFLYGSDQIRWVQKWPGRSQANENKVPTILVYPHERDTPSSWGFLADSQPEHSHGVTREWFKTLLEPRNLQAENERNPHDPITHDDVRKWFRDYLSLVYENIQERLVSELPSFDWSQGKIEFLFSVPTTWNPSIVEEFRSLIGQAGFGGPANARHTVTVSLTEPEAAAVFTSTAANGIFREDDVLVVCDAGGGTTDICALKVKDTAVGALSLKQLRALDVVSGENVGSAAIDYEFELLARERLRGAQDLVNIGIDVEEAAWEMAKCRQFQDAKCDYGSRDKSEVFSVPVPTLGTDFTEHDLNVINGQMLFDREELRGLFDAQTEKIFRLIDGQLSKLNSNAPNEVVSHLVLSGGLGQSPYVQQRLRERYGEGSYIFPNAQTMQVRVAPDPQLAVCKGLVADRLRKLKAGESVLGWRCCRASYGLICKELYDRGNRKHFNRNPEKDHRDNKLYVTDSIDWFVEKGSPVSIDQPMVHTFRRKMSPGDPRKVFPTKIVVSYRERGDLPYFMDGGAERLCDVESDLSSIDESVFKVKNKRLWQPGEPYYQIQYEVKVIIGPADLRFELWFNGQKLSKDNSIKVEWAPSTAPSTAALQAPPPLPAYDEPGVLKERDSRRRLQRIFSSPAVS